MEMLFDLTQLSWEYFSAYFGGYFWIKLYYVMMLQQNWSCCYFSPALYVMEDNHNGPWSLSRVSIYYYL